jgi:hypothetical protein
MKINYTIPTTQDEITLEQWMKFENNCITRGYRTRLFTKKMLEIFCNVPNEYSQPS